MIHDFKKELALISKQIAEANKVRTKETQNLIRHLEESMREAGSQFRANLMYLENSTRDVINQCRENLRNIDDSSDMLISLLVKIEHQKERE